MFFLNSYFQMGSTPIDRPDLHGEKGEIGAGVYGPDNGCHMGRIKFSYVNHLFLLL
jgi:hypothetical protein